MLHRRETTPVSECFAAKCKLLLAESVGQAAQERGDLQILPGFGILGRGLDLLLGRRGLSAAANVGGAGWALCLGRRGVVAGTRAEQAEEAAPAGLRRYAGIG